MKFIVGLGNPGERYRYTRHNAGFLAVDAFAREIGAPPEREAHGAGLREAVIDGRTTLLVKPLHYMNESGPPVADLMAALGRSLGAIPAEDLLVVHDDIDLPLGRVRFRATGSSGGHLGLESLLGIRGGAPLPRLKIGVSRPEGARAADHVLEPLHGSDREALLAVAARVAPALRLWVLEGLEASARRFNGQSLLDPDTTQPDATSQGPSPTENS